MHAVGNNSSHADFPLPRYQLHHVPILDSTFFGKVRERLLRKGVRGSVSANPFGAG